MMSQDFAKLQGSWYVMGCEFLLLSNCSLPARIESAVHSMQLITEKGNLSHQRPDSIMRFMMR